MDRQAKNVALVTGGSSGIGFETSLRLAAWWNADTNVSRVSASGLLG